MIPSLVSKFFLLLIFGGTLSAKADSGIQVGLTQASYTIQNPDNTEAVYSGLQYQLVYDRTFDRKDSYGMNLGLTKGSLDNTNDDSSNKETLELLSYEASGYVQAYNFKLGYGVSYTDAEHIGAASNFSDSLDYNVLMHGYTVGFGVQKKTVGYGLKYTDYSGEISNSDTNLSTDSDISAQAWWVYISFNLGRKGIGGVLDL